MVKDRTMAVLCPVPVVLFKYLIPRYLDKPIIRLVSKLIKPSHRENKIFRDLYGNFPNIMVDLVDGICIFLDVKISQCWRHSSAIILTQLYLLLTHNPHVLHRATCMLGHVKMHMDK